MKNDYLKSWALGIVSVVACFGMQNTASGGDDVCVDFFAQGLYESTSRYIAASGDLVYFDSGPKLVAMSMLDPEHPVVLGEIELEFAPGHIAVEGTIAYMIVGGQLTMIDIAEPASMVVLGSFDPAGYVHDLVVENKVVFLVQQDDGLRIVDANNPAKPTLLSHLATLTPAPDQTSWMYDISIDWSTDGAIGYVAATKGIDVLDLSDLTSPTRIGRYDYENFFSVLVEITHEGNKVYACTLDHTPFSFILELDVSDPTNPIETQLAIGGAIVGVPSDLIIQDGMLFYTTEHITLGVTDTNAPDGARQRWSYTDWPFTGHNLSLAGDRAFITGDVFQGPTGLWTIDVDFDCPGECWADLNDDGLVNYFDLALWVPAYIAGDIAADVNNNGRVQSTDIASMIEALENGCP